MVQCMMIDIPGRIRDVAAAKAPHRPDDMLLRMVNHKQELQVFQLALLLIITLGRSPQNISQWKWSFHPRELQIQRLESQV